MMLFLFFFFFFQAEDGIRDWSVTGVQTCALPIWEGRRFEDEPEDAAEQVGPARIGLSEHDLGRLRVRSVHRSEERRVGKECRSRWSPYQYKKKKTIRDKRKMRNTNVSAPSI